jgi:hypothetical protein
MFGILEPRIKNKELFFFQYISTVRNFWEVEIRVSLCLFSIEWNSRLLFRKYLQWLELSRELLVPIESINIIWTFGQRLLLPLGPKALKKPIFRPKTQFLENKKSPNNGGPCAYAIKKSLT